MLITAVSARHRFLNGYVSFAVFLFLSLSLILPNGYSAGALLLLIGSSILLFTRAKTPLSANDGLLITCLIGYFLVTALSNALHHLPMSSYDNPSRFMLAVPALVLLIAYPPKPTAIFSGAALGALLAAALAVYQVRLLGHDRANGYLNSIQFGDMAILLVSICIIGARWMHLNNKPAGLVFFLFAAASGCIASFLSGSRGGWLELPLLALLFLGPSIARKSKRFLAGYLIAALLLAVCFYLLAGHALSIRIHDAWDDIQHYLNGDNIPTSIGIRLDMWGTAWHAFLEKPFLGWGNIEIIKQHYAERWAYINQVDPHFSHFHNEYLDALAKRGLLGFVALLSLHTIPLVLFIKYLNRPDKSPQGFALLGVFVVIGCMIFGLSQTFLAHNSGSTFYAFLLIIVWSLCSDSQKNTESTEGNATNSGGHR